MASKVINHRDMLTEIEKFQEYLVSDLQEKLDAKRLALGKDKKLVSSDEILPAMEDLLVEFPEEYQKKFPNLHMLFNGTVKEPFTYLEVIVDKGTGSLVEQSAAQLYMAMGIVKRGRNSKKIELADEENIESKKQVVELLETLEQIDAEQQTNENLIDLMTDYIQNLGNVDEETHDVDTVAKYNKAQEGLAILKGQNIYQPASSGGLTLPVYTKYRTEMPESPSAKECNKAFDDYMNIPENKDTFTKHRNLVSKIIETVYQLLSGNKQSAKANKFASRGAHLVAETSRINPIADSSSLLSNSMSSWMSESSESVEDQPEHVDDQIVQQRQGNEVEADPSSQDGDDISLPIR